MAKKKTSTSRKAGSASRKAPARSTAPAKRGKSAGKKTGKATAKKTGRKAAGRKPAGRGGRSAAPSAVSSGRGATPREIGQAVADHFNKGGADKVLWDKYWHANVESIEGDGMALAWKGRKAMEGKSQWWSENHKVHSASAEGPYVGATGFALKFRMDTEEKATGKRTQGEEIGVYTVQNGKVIREEFMYGPNRVISEGSRSSADDVDELEESDEPEMAYI